MKYKSSSAIILVGMMGAGKSSIGRLLSIKLKKKFLDLDVEIEKAQNLNISEIFERFGEKYFRNIEVEMISKILNKKKNIILSLGGGAYNKKTNFINKKGLTIWLDASFEVLYQRLKNNIRSRPLLKNRELFSELNELIKKREEDYKLAEIRINVDELNINEIVDIIIKKINNCKKNDQSHN